MLICATGATAAVQSCPPGQLRADIVDIDSLKAFGRLERGPVQFLHDKHTQALEKEGKDCSACHMKEKDSNRLSMKFMRLKDSDRKTEMNLYHANCISCHDRMIGEGKDTGPVECAGCHTKAVRAVSDREPMGLDHSLHYRHEKALDKKCELCHHEYDKATKKLVYVKGHEGTCRYCHKAQTEENRISMRLASHEACVNCHLERRSQKLSAGPVQCAGCHDPAKRKLIEVIAEPPRMEMKQPDALFVKTGTKPDDERIHMNLVPFDHKAHEGSNDTCRVCHHASLSTCSGCHTLNGKKEGNWINLAQSMHQKGDMSSCIGCHTEKETAKNCAGCHGQMSPTRKESDATCRVCHMAKKDPNAPIPEDTQQADQLAAQLLADRTPTTGTVAEKDIPETVTIKSLSDKYKPAEMPHRKIVLALAAGVKDSKLAAYFHTNPATLCQGCHHNSPPSTKPPLCSSCHGKPFDEQNPYRPGLMAAYHQQCMGCHKAMGLQKPASRDCTACHKEK
jgi:hypothetical protein